MIVILKVMSAGKLSASAKIYLPVSAGSVKAIDFFIRSQLSVTLPAL